MIKSILIAAALAAASATGVAAAAVDGHMEAAARPTIASTIKELLANEQTAPVLEKHLPGVSQHPMLGQFEDMTLAQVMPLSGGAITQETIDKIDADLKALPAA